MRSVYSVRGCSSRIAKITFDPGEHRLPSSNRGTCQRGIRERRSFCEREGSIASVEAAGGKAKGSIKEDESLSALNPFHGLVEAPRPFEVAVTDNAGQIEAPDDNFVSGNLINSNGLSSNIQWEISSRKFPFVVELIKHVRSIDGLTVYFFINLKLRDSWHWKTCSN